MEAELSCPLCGVEYSEERVPRILAACGHTFCETCIQGKVASDAEGRHYVACPEDHIRCQMSTKDVKLFPINRSLLRIAESTKVKTPHKDSSFQLSKTTKEEEFQEDIETHSFKETAHTNLLEQSPYSKTHFDCAQLKHKEQIQFFDEQNMCLLHQKPLEIVCVYDLQKICSKCAIFGQHKGHDFKSLEQIQQQKNQFSERLVTVFGLKKEIMNRIQNKTTKSEIVSILNVKTQALSKEIQSKFNALVEAITAQEGRVLKNLELNAKIIEKAIDDLYKIDATLISSYEDWENTAMLKLDCIKKGSFEEQLKLLIKVESMNEKNSLSEGQSLVDLMRAQEQNIISNSQALLGSLNIKVCDKIFEYIPNYVNVLEKPEYPEKSLDFQPFIEYSPQGSNQINLLEVQGSNEEICSTQKVTFPQSPILSMKELQIKPSNEITKIDIQPEQVKLIPFLEGKVFQEKNSKKPVERKTLTKRQFPREKIKTQISQQTFLHTSRQLSFLSQKNIRLAKKKLKNFKVPQKYEKIIESLSADTLQTLDLTNAQLGDAVVLQICELLSGSKVKTVKLIRNKLTDEGLSKMLPFMQDLVTLNLSQNLLTDKILDILIQNRQMIPKVKNIVLSLNKIVERKDKKKIDELRKLQIVVSV